MKAGFNRHDRFDRVCAFVASVTAVGFLWMLALSVSPELHSSVHADASGVTHECGATLLSSGHCQDVPVQPTVLAPVILRSGEPVSEETAPVPSAFLLVRILEHAPPSAA